MSCRIDLPSVHVPSPASRERKTMCGMRESLVGTRTKLVNTVRGWLRAEGRRPRSGELSTFSTRVRALASEAPLPTSVERQLRMIDAVNDEISQADRELTAAAKGDPVARRLMTAPGVGPATAVRFVAALDEISRFPGAHAVESYQWVRLRTRVQNTLHAIALGSGVQRGHTLWNRDGQAMLTALPLPSHAAHRRDELQRLYHQLDEQVDRLDDRVKDVATQRPRATELMTHPGVGHITALATEVFLGDPSRFADGKALASYVGMIPSEYSSGRRQRLGGLSKQGNPLLRFLWGEAAMHAVRRDPELQRFYRRKLQQKGHKARVAAGRKLGIRLWIMLRDQISYDEFCRRNPRRQS